MKIHIIIESEIKSNGCSWVKFKNLEHKKLQIFHSDKDVKLS